MTTPDVAELARGLAGGDWHDIDDAPTGELIDIWVEGLEEPGWIITGRIIEREPCRIDDDETGCPYWPCQNGGYPTHWRSRAYLSQPSKTIGEE